MFRKLLITLRYQGLSYGKYLEKSSNGYYFSTSVLLVNRKTCYYCCFSFFFLFFFFIFPPPPVILFSEIPVHFFPSCSESLMQIWTPMIIFRATYYDYGTTYRKKQCDSQSLFCHHFTKQGSLYITSPWTAYFGKLASCVLLKPLLTVS